MACDPKSFNILERFRDPLAHIEVLGQGLRVGHLRMYNEDQRNFMRNMANWAQF